MNCTKCGAPRSGAASGEFCAECAVASTPTRVATPEAIEKYHTRLSKFAGDGVIEAWEEDELQKLRQRWGIGIEIDRAFRLELNVPDVNYISPSTTVTSPQFDLTPMGYYDALRNSPILSATGAVLAGETLAIDLAMQAA